MIKNRLKWAWWGLTGEAEERLRLEKDYSNRLRVMAEKAHDLERQLGFARAAIAELKSHDQLSEDIRKRDSDRLAEEAIKRMT